jgi:hypothetical protein
LDRQELPLNGLPIRESQAPLVIMIWSQIKTQSAKVDFLPTGIYLRSTCDTFVKHRQALLTINQKPAVGAGRVKGREDVQILPKQVIVRGPGFPAKERPDRHVVKDAIEQCCGTGTIPDEFALKFGHRKHAISKPVV